MRLRYRFLVVFIIAGASSHAQAQWSPDATMDLGAGYGQIALGQSTLNGTRAIGATSKTAFSKTTADDASTDEPPSSEIFAFDRSEAITTLVNRHYAEWRSSKHPELHDQILAEFESGQYQDYFNDILDKHDFDRDNLVDVTAIFYMSLWKIVHGQELTDQQIAGVRRQILASMARDARLTGLSDVEKQEIAETFALHTALALKGYDMLVRNGDTARLASFRADLQRTMVPAGGPDLKYLAVNDQGFVSKR